LWLHGKTAEKGARNVPDSEPAAGFDPLGRQLNVAARATRSLLDSVLAEAGTTFSSWTVLAALGTRGPSIQKDLAKSLDMIGPSIVERIDQLEESGLVARSSVPGDRRASLVSLTDDGRALLARLGGVMRTTETALTSGLDPREVETTRRVLAHIAEQARALRAERPG
jgi:MarR family transcriptional regulator, transcriptional regulator for hemolysin